MNSPVSMIESEKIKELSKHKIFWKKHKTDIVKYGRIIVPCLIVVISLITGADMLDAIF